MLAYNLLRSLMWSAGTTYTTPPNRLSLQGTRHHLINFIPKLLAATSIKRLQIYRTLLKVIAHRRAMARSLWEVTGSSLMPKYQIHLVLR
jgi:hypothetical protein